MIFTIGHSNRTPAAFLDLLAAHGIRQVVDVRAIPWSRRHPHFSAGALANWLSTHDIGYRHLPALGGRRQAAPDSINTALRDPALRGYADHMQTPEFAAALSLLVTSASAAPTTVMCAEADWRMCHRQLLADALVGRGEPVLHILSTDPAKLHAASEFARLEGVRVIYPGLL